MDANTVKKKLRDFIKLTLSKEEQDILKKIKMDGTPMPYTTNDGKQIFVTGVDTDGIIDIGLPAFSDAAGTIPMPDGSYTLADGTSVTIAGGIVADLKAPASSGTPPANPPAVAPVDMNAVNAAIATAMAANKKEVDTLKTELAGAQKLIVTLSKQLEEILEVEFNNTPVQMSTEPKYIAPTVKAKQRIKENEMNPKH